MVSALTSSEKLTPPVPSLKMSLLGLTGTFTYKTTLNGTMRYTTSMMVMIMMLDLWKVLSGSSMHWLSEELSLQEWYLIPIIQQETVGIFAKWHHSFSEQLAIRLVTSMKTKKEPKCFWECTIIAHSQFAELLLPRTSDISLTGTTDHRI